MCCNPTFTVYDLNCDPGTEAEVQDKARGMAGGTESRG